MRRLPGLAVLVLSLALAACGSVGGSGHAGEPAPGVSAPVSSPPVSSPPVSSPPASSPPASPPVSVAATLSSGMSGPAVRQLQDRLAALRYYPGATDGEFGQDTLEAVWAFQEAQGLPPTGTVGPATRAALASPHDPAVLVPGGGSTRIEINLADEVLVLYRAGQIALISHVSTGGGYYYCSAGGCGYAVTPTGDFRTLSFMPGWITVPLGEMYNSVFFIGSAYAIHGDTYVPLQPASHGCVRLPMDIAEFFHTLVPTPGTPVYIRR